MKKMALLIDIPRCNGCYNCQLACKDEHVGNDWSPIAKPQPNTGHFWWKVTETVQGTVPKVRVHYMHDVCQECDDPACMKSCPNNAIYKREKDGFVIIDPEKCRGSKECLLNCPYHAIYFNQDLNISQKCTRCVHLLDDGTWTQPRCVQSCPTDALIFGEYENLKGKIEDEGFEKLHPEYGTGSNVWYKGLLNKFFIAGEVYDPVEDEELEGVTVTLTGKDGSKKTVKTDVFGDFWFERNEPAVYDLSFELSGYKSAEMKNIDATEKDINVGPVQLFK